MKKGIVAIFIIAALVILVSPGIVGKLAEKSVDEQLKWAADENQEVVITSEKFDRGWFSSAGRHRIEFGKSGAGAELREQFGFRDGEPTPALIVETRLDHGLVPVGSINQDEGSLAPGLGHAVSTLSIESGDGRITTLPGVVHSHVGLDGGVSSTYTAVAGSAGTVGWGAANLEVNANALKGRIAVNGDLESLSFMSPENEAVSLGRFDLKADMVMTEFGYAVGDLALSIDSIDIVRADRDIDLGPFTIDATSSVDDERLNLQAEMEFASGATPIGDFGWSFDLVVNGMDAAAAGRVQRAVERTQGIEDPDVLFAMVEKDLMDLVAGGFEVRFDRLNITLPEGTAISRFNFELPPSDRQSFAWTGVLLDLKANVDVRIPDTLYEFAASMNPQVAMAVAMGVLKKNGDDYEIVAEYRKGLLTVNGAPMPIPLPQM